MTFHFNDRGNSIPHEGAPGEAVDARSPSSNDSSSSSQGEDNGTNSGPSGEDLSLQDYPLDSIEFGGYLIREDGAVFNKKGLRLKHNIVVNRNGRHYPKFRLYIDKKIELWFAHRLMAWVFLASGHMELSEFKTAIVDHLDNDPMNYHLMNIEILRGHSENLRRRHREFSSEPIPF